MREIVTLILDVFGLLLVAAGAAALVFPWLGWAGLILAGVVVLVGSWLADRLADRQARPAGSGGA